MSKVITILLPDGNPNGIKIVELANFTGKVLVVPRGKLKEIKDREEAMRPAVYYLFGEGENESRKIVYIGESEQCYKRLVDHDTNKDFWNLAIMFVGEFDRADVKYFENKSVTLARAINRYEIINKNGPFENRLSEAKRVVADEVLEKVKFILAFLGFTLFQEIPESVEGLEMYTFKTENALAKGKLLDTEEFIVYAGSTARIRETDSFRGGGPALRRQLVDHSVLKRKDNFSYEFTRDCIFTSPSAAADTVAGRSSNGWTAWKDINGKTLDENKR